MHNELLHGRVNEVDDQSGMYSSQRSVVACGNGIVIRSSRRDEVIFGVWYGINLSRVFHSKLYHCIQIQMYVTGGYVVDAMGT